MVLGRLRPPDGRRGGKVHIPMKTTILRLTLALILMVSAFSGYRFTVAAQDSSISIGASVSTDQEGVNIRKTPGTSGTIVTALSAGVGLTVTDGPTRANGYNWWKVEITDSSSVDDGVSGWIAEDYLTLDDVVSPPDDNSTPTATATATQDGDNATPTATPTSDDTDPFASAGWVTVKDGPVNLRSAAGTTATIVDTLLTGANATVSQSASLKTANGYTWVSVVSSDGIKGWLATDFLTALTEDPCANNQCSSDDVQQYLDATTVQVVDGPVNLRSDPSLDGEVLAVGSTGTLLTVSTSPKVTAADGYDWLSVDVQDQSGWVATDFVDVSDASCDASPCDPDSSGDSTDPFASAKGVEVVDGPVNVRDAAGLDGTIVTTVDTGYTAAVDSRSELETADGYTWIKIVTGTTGTWMATDFLEPLDNVPDDVSTGVPADLAAFVNADAAVVSDGPLNLRVSPDTSADIVMTLEAGDYLWIIDTSASEPWTNDNHLWIKVTVAGETGYVAIDYLTAVE
jgi:uncharacterized protein YgiM (DUF1202 family)